MDFARRRFAAADFDRLVHAHASHYAQVEGFGDSFGPLVADIVQRFLSQHQPRDEADSLA